MVFNHLEHILNLENIGYEKEALEMIARTGAGSLRDSLTLLDQAIVYSKNFVDVATITQMLGIIEPSHLENLIASIIAKDHDKVFEFINLASEYETEMILDELSLYIKDMMFAQNRLLSPLIIERFFRVIANSKELLKMGSDGTFVLSLTLFKMMESLELKDIDTLIKNLEKELHGLPAVSKPPHQSSSHLAESASLTPTTDDKQEEIDIAPQAEVTPPSNHNKSFNLLVQKIYDRDYVVGSCFERTTTFGRYEDNTLYWNSTADGEDKEKLKAGFGIIRKLAQDIFGPQTQIKNLPSKPSVHTETISQTEPASQVMQEDNTMPPPVGQLQDCLTGSMIEDVEMQSSCMMPEAANEAGKEKDPSSLLEETMVKEAIGLFEPSKVRVIQKV